MSRNLFWRSQIEIERACSDQSRKDSVNRSGREPKYGGGMSLVVPLSVSSPIRNSTSAATNFLPALRYRKVFRANNQILMTSPV